MKNKKKMEVFLLLKLWIFDTTHMQKWKISKAYALGVYLHSYLTLYYINYKRRKRSAFKGR